MAFDLDNAIAAWRRPFEHNRAFSMEDVEELEASLRDRVAALVEGGWSEAAAFREALRRMGAYGTAEAEYRKVYWGKRRRRGEVLHELHARAAMLTSYVKIAFRNVMRQKGYAFINVAGLSIGLACSFFILLWVMQEIRVDRFHEHGDRIYRVWRNETNNGKVFTRPTVSGPMGPALTKDYPDIENATFAAQGQVFVITHAGQSFRELGRYVSADFFEVFTFPLIEGDPATALQAENVAVISERLAARLFGPGWRNSGLIGETITIDHDEDFTITAIAEDPPDHSTLQFDVLLPIRELFAENDWMLQWGGNSLPLYVRLSQGASPVEVNAKIAGVIERYSPNEQGEVIFLQPFEEVYLHDRFENGVNTGGRIELIRIFTMVAAFLLVIAAINFTNLSTARSMQRSKEISVRKAVGATQPLLAAQFMTETMVLAILSFGIAMALVLGLMPVFNLLTGKHVGVTELSPSFLAIVFGVALLTGLLAGSYPALYLASYKPVALLRGTFRKKPGGARMRKGLVAFQFALSTLIIICTAAVYLQIQYVMERDIGLDRGNVVTFGLEGSMRARYEAFRQVLMQQSGIVNVAASTESPFAIARSTSSPTWAGKDPDDETEFSLIDVSYDFVETMKMELVAGRAHDRSFGTDSAGYLINEQAAKVMGKEHPVGERLEVFGQPGQVIGVVKDFYMSDVSFAPTLIRLAPANTGRVWVRTEPGKTQEALTGMEAVYKRFNPGYPFTYAFLDKEYEEMYRSVLVMGRLANVFAVIAMMISCLGLFGLASFTAERRTKEIGIRKALGAPVSRLVLLLSMDFTRLVLIGFALGAPLAWIVANRWLDGFAYRADLNPMLFVLTGGAALVIAWLTVSYQAIKAARADPVKSLRNE